MKIGIIGVGNIGGNLARQYRKAGHDVLIANSREPETLAELASEIGAQAVSAVDAVRDVDLVVISVPLRKVAELPDGLLDAARADTIVIETTNYYPGKTPETRVAALDEGGIQSQWVAEQLGRPVVKVYNSIFAASLGADARPDDAEGRIALPVAADDPAARERVIALLQETGFDGYDAGTIDESWRFQPGTPAYCTNLSLEQLPANLAAADREASPAKLQELIAALSALPADATFADRIAAARGAEDTIAG